MVALKFSGILGVSLHPGALNLTTQRLYTEEVDKHYVSESYPQILGNRHHLTELCERTDCSV